MIKYTFLIFSLLILVGAKVSAADIEYSLPDSLLDLNFWNQEGEFVGNLALSETPPLPHLEVVPQSGVVDHQEIYQIRLTLPQGGIPKLGGVSFSFPTVFGLSQIEEIEYSDNYSGSDLRIRRVYVQNNIITILFRWGNSPPAGTIVTFTVHSIKNPTVSGEYQIAGLIFNKWYRVESGPTISERFAIIPDEPAAISISPDSSITVRAGEAFIFSAAVSDRFGNIIPNPALQWSLSDDSEPIGTVTLGNFFATTLGQGRVVAQYGSLLAQSGLITVVPGTIDHFEILSYPVTVRAGETFESPVIVRAVDLFGNRVIDFNGAVYFLSSDDAAEFYYNQLREYTFMPADSGEHSFEGELFVLKTSGQQTITATDGAHSGRSGLVSVLPGKIAAFSLTGEEQATSGEQLTLQIADAVDNYGNPTSGIAAITLVDEGISPDGFEPILNDIYIVDGYGTAGQYLYRSGGSTFKATVNFISREFSVTVSPGPLGRMTLAVQPTQFLGNPLIGPATLIMFDRFGNLKVDFDASSNPVTFHTDHGALQDGVLDDFDDFSEGIADSSITSIVYNGPAGLIHIYASEGSITSNISDLFINGLHLAFRNLPSDTIFAGQHLDLNVLVINDGDLSPQSPAILTSSFVSCGDLCSDSLLILKPPLPGTEGSVRLQKSTALLTPRSEDTLLLGIISRYSSNGIDYYARQSLIHSLYLLDSLSIQYVSNSLTLDTVMSPSQTPPFSLQMELNRPIDPLQYTVSALYSLRLGDSSEIIIPDEGQMISISTDGRFLDLQSSGFQIPEIKDDPEEGYKKLSAEIVMRSSEGIVLRQKMSDFDSLCVLFRGVISYNRFSLFPRVIPAGETRHFEFSVQLEGSADILLDSSRSYFQLIGFDRVLDAKIRNHPVALYPGRNQITTGDIYISPELLDQQLIPRFIMSGAELYTTRTDTVSFIGENIFVTGLPEIKIISTELMTVNPPFVNYGQNFQIKTIIRNLADASIAEVSLIIVSEDGQDTLASSYDNNLSPMGDLEISLPIKAESISVPIKIYRTEVRSPLATTVPSDDNTAAVTIQSPAEIELVYTLSGVYEGYVDFGQNFAVAARLRNLGEADALPGQVTLATGGIDFGIPDPSSQTVEIGGIANFNLTAPSYSVSTDLELEITEIPIDRNTGQAALVKVGSAIIPISVEPSQAELVVSGQVFQGPLVIEGSSPTLFDLKLRNSTENPLNVIGLLSITLMVSDNQDNPLSPDMILIPESTAFLINGTAAVYGEPDDGYLRFQFDDFLLQSKEEKVMRFRARLNDKIEIGGFSLTLENRDISAVFASGPRINQPVPVRGEFDNNFRLSGNFIVTPPSLGQSLIAKSNPFNPNLEKAEIAYSLERDATVSMKIFTLAGEEVLAVDFPAGGDGGRQGANYVSWDGRNENGKIVLNGVYVVVFREQSSGQSYKLKLAVMK